MAMRLIRFAIGVSLVAVSVLGSARAQSPAELSLVSGQEALTNRFESPVSETDRLSDRRQLNAYFLARSQDRLRWAVSSPPAEKELAHPRQIDRKQGAQGYQRTQVVGDNGASANRLVHRLIQRRALPKQGW